MKAGIEAVASQNWGSVSPCVTSAYTYLNPFQKDFKVVVSPPDVRTSLFHLAQAHNLYVPFLFIFPGTAPRFSSPFLLLARLFPRLSTTRQRVVLI